MDGDGGGLTDFSAHSHGELIAMVQSMNSGAVMAAADPWRRAADTLGKIQGALTTATTDATSTWQGTTSEAFQTRMTSLANTVSAAAAYAGDAAGALQLMAGEIDKAKSAMPEEPGFWDKVGDSVSDSVQESVGIDNADTQHTIAESRKQEAVGVMQTLAVSYRAATSHLRVPPSGSRESERELTPPDNGGTEALGALIVGAGAGLVQSRTTTGSSSGSRLSSQSSVSSRTPQAPKVQPTVVRPTDSGISGGTANAVSQPKGPGTGIDGVQTGTSVRGSATGVGGVGGTGGVHSPSGAGGFGLTGGGSVGNLAGHGAEGIMGGAGVGGSRAGFSGNSVSKAGTFGAGGLNGGAGATGGLGSRPGGGTGGGAGGGAGAGGRSGSGLTSKGGGVVGEAAHASAGGRTFTEGGSGIGRNRFGQGAGAAHAGGPGQAGGGHGGMAGHGQAGKKGKKKGSDRPDYLVEDEETWAAGGSVNPDVVE